MSTNDIKRRADIIVGYETKVMQIIEKWRVCKRDQDEIIDLMAKIEEDTIKLVLAQQREVQYTRTIARLQQDREKKK